MNNAPEKYARALAGAAVDAGTLPDIRKDFGVLSDLLDSSEELSCILRGCGFSKASEKRAVRAVIEGHVSGLFLRFIEQVIEKRRGAMIKKIKTKFDELADEAEGKINVTIETAFPVEKAQEDKLAEIISNKLKKTVILDKVTDKGLIGGIRLKAGDLVIDGTLKTRLEMLGKELCSC